MPVLTHAVCTFCGCTCDDIELHVAGNRIVKTRNTCSLGDAWFRNHPADAEAGSPAALVDGQPATLEAAVEAAADYLVRAHYPLVYGLSAAACEAQGKAVGLTELLSGVIDSHASI